MEYDEDRPSRRPSGIQEEFERQEKLLEVLAVTIVDLTAALSPYVAPERPVEADGPVSPKPDPAPVSPLLSRVRVANRRLEGFAVRLRALTERID